MIVVQVLEANLSVVKITGLPHHLDRDGPQVRVRFDIHLGPKLLVTPKRRHPLSWQEMQMVQLLGM